MAKKQCYVVLVGEKPGIYASWAECEAQVKGWKGAKYKGFGKREEAEKYYNEYMGIAPAMEHKEQEATKSESCLENLIRDLKESNKDEEQDSLLEQLNAKIKESRQHPEAVLPSVEEFCHSYGYENFTNAQKRAVQAICGKNLLFAVPGSGKTTVLLARVGYLLHGRHGLQIQPQELANLSFTKAAATEMRERYRKKFPDAQEIPDFRTIHSFCYKFILPKLRAFGVPMPPYLIDTDENANRDAMLQDMAACNEHSTRNLKEQRTQYHVLKAVMKKMKISHNDEIAREAVISLITYIKNQQLLPEDYQDKVFCVNRNSYSVSKLMASYEQELEIRQCYDMDDMLRYSVDGLKQYPQILAQLQDKYHYWSIDEAQDNSSLQNELIMFLAGEDGNLFVVGDDDQSIYSFRGAEPLMLLEYGLQANVMAMDINYRSGRNIVGAAREFIEENKCRADKIMEPASDARQGSISFYTKYKTARSQYEHVAEAARQCTSNGKTLGVLYRYNASAFPLFHWLRKHGICYESSTDYRSLAYGRIYSSVMSILALAVHPWDIGAYHSCKYLFKLCLLKENEEKLHKLLAGQRKANILECLESLQENLHPHILEAAALLKKVKRLKPEEAVKDLIEHAFEDEFSGSERLRAFGIMSASMVYDSVAEFVEAHEAILKEAENPHRVQQNVSISSMHGSKGRQFDHVIIIDPWQLGKNNVLSEQNTLHIDNAEEERRIFYVAATRAKSRLDIIAPECCFGHNLDMVNFVNDLAYAYEKIISDVLELMPVEKQESREVALQFKEKWYGVKIGARPGVYKDFNTEVKPLVDRYSNAQYKSFESRQEAEHYVYGKSQENAACCHKALDSIMKGRNRIAAMRAMDLPRPVNRLILNYFEVADSLLELSAQRVQGIKDNTVKYSYHQETNYNGKVDYYILAYMLVNFYKIWTPLYALLEKNCLKKNIHVLELGAGPGTATLSLWCFYIMLARENPAINFHLQHTTVEREADFVRALRYMAAGLLDLARLPNLHIEYDIWQKDIYDVDIWQCGDKYDLIFESNVLNNNECIAPCRILQLVDAMYNSLLQGGHMIILEPAISSTSELFGLIDRYMSYNTELQKEEAANRISVSLSKISLLRQVRALKIRTDQNMEHYYAYMNCHKGETL